MGTSCSMDTPVSGIKFWQYTLYHQLTFIFNLILCHEYGYRIMRCTWAQKSLRSKVSPHDQVTLTTGKIGQLAEAVNQRFYVYAVIVRLSMQAALKPVLCNDVQIVCRPICYFGHFGTLGQRSTGW